jgi:hypothetical protein
MFFLKFDLGLRIFILSFEIMFLQLYYQQVVLKWALWFYMINSTF